MGLETFDFIPDLVDTNPEPTDPVAQGDDHLRGIKFTLQNQFPVIGENAVDLTALQINDAALQSEPNIFTAPCSFSEPIQGADGDAVLPGYSFISDPSAGMYSSPSLLGFATDGVERLRLTTSQARFSVDQMFMQNGGAAAPAYSFLSNPDLGIYRDTADRLSFATEGTLRMLMDVGRVQAEVPFRAIPGTAGVPAFAFSAEPNTGILNPSTGVLALAVSGAERMRLSSTATTNNQQFRNLDGSSALPAYAFGSGSNMGMYKDSTNGLGFSTGGARRLFVGNTSMLLTNGVILTLNGNMNARKAGTTSVAGYNFQDATPVTRWALQVTTDANSNNLALRRSNNAGASQGDIMIWKQNGNISMPQLPTSTAGLVSGDLWRNPVSPGFVAII